MSIDLLEFLKLLDCKSPQTCWLSDNCQIDAKGIRANLMDVHTENLLTPDEWNIRKQFEKDIYIELPCKASEFGKWVNRNNYNDLISTNRIINDDDGKPWLIEDSRDPTPKEPWYVPARYFARLHVAKDPTLLTKRSLICTKVVKSLDGKGIKKRGGKHSFSPETIKKALANVILS
jgi:hypothetical protein